MAGRYITVTGARQNNLRNVSAKIPLNKITVVTGVSGSGKSSLAFDTIYAEGQRRYVETFSAYTRQFLDRMDKPKVDEIDGIPAAIAIDQTNPVRTSRSTVGTMTELNDHIKLLFPRVAELNCGSCGRPVSRDTAESVVKSLNIELGKRRLKGIMITFPVKIPNGMDYSEVVELLKKSGYERIHRHDADRVEVVQDRVRLSKDSNSRIVSDLEAGFHMGDGKVIIHPVAADGSISEETHLYSTDLHCPHCDISYSDPVPNLFSFNSPIGACEECRGFGRVIGIDMGLVIPDESKSLLAGAIKPWQTKSYRECQDDLKNRAKEAGVRLDVPWSKLTKKERTWVIEGEGEWDEGHWYGIRRFFEWLEGRSYKMHIRVLLSRYRSYNRCPNCNGARLKSESLNWRIRGKTIHEIALTPIGELVDFFGSHEVDEADEATLLIVSEIRSRIRYLSDVGLDYLTLDRQSRTLSGGEVQRINLITALGTLLTNTLFVLDEPSIGLHSRDIKRLIGVLDRLKRAGNTLLVVEHDPEVITAADHVIDMGPGPGERGGEIVFAGSVRSLARATRSLTSRYLFTSRSRSKGTMTEATRDRGKELIIRGAAEHNLREIKVRIPLGKLVCLSGVSGSGKSTLLDEILFRGAMRHFGRPTDEPGLHDGIDGLDLFSGVLFVDQTAIGKTTRSNPASFVGAFDAIRALFADDAQSKRRGYTAGTFSFNSGHGRCATCGGTGFEHVEMQFLSDIYLRCPECDGSRYRQEVREIKISPNTDRATKSIDQVLEMTVSEAVDYFAGEQRVLVGLEPLLAVGLGYLRLGQPVPTLSGGEAQRLKLAGHLAQFGGRRSKGSVNGVAPDKPTLFLFDEPTTGLHFADIEVLLEAFRNLVDLGHSVIVIEHNLDVLTAADWIIDLGPEGGLSGGDIVDEGTPMYLSKRGTGHTATALRRFSANAQPAEFVAAEKEPQYNSSNGKNGRVTIRGAREHNLQNVDIEIPLNKLIVITGVSGSGKSTVAFDILFSEGQRRYLESLNAYARQFVQPSSRPDVDLVSGVPPTVAIEQRTSRGGRKSTVGTVTEIYYFLRLLFTKLGIQHCADCHVPIESRTAESIHADVSAKYVNQVITLLAPLVVSRKGYYTDLADWARRKGFTHLRVDGVDCDTSTWPRLDRYREHSIDLPVGTIDLSEPRAELFELIRKALDLGSGRIRVSNDSNEQFYSVTRSCPSCGRSFPEADPRLFSFNSKHGWCESCDGTGVEGMSDEDEAKPARAISHDSSLEPCGSCHGTRLNSVARSVLFRNKNISDYSGMSVTSLGEAIKALDFVSREKAIAEDMISEIETRLKFLERVGLGYVSVDRAAPTLSGGEAQRIRLAAQLGSNLRGVCYILDEPTIGLHSRDNEMLLDTLVELNKKGNTVVVVEHDDETIRRADHVIDLGPGAGSNGGHLVATGTVRGIMRSKRSVTGRMLSQPLRHPFAGRTDRSQLDRTKIKGKGKPVSRAKKEYTIRIKNASLHNLRGIDVSIPRKRLVCVTGVSGSGKSTLVRDVLYNSISRLKREGVHAVGCDKITGVDGIEHVLEVDQTPIGKTPRSCPATYVGIWNDIRKLYSEIPEARMRGYDASRFSFNTKGGRCESCGGQGYQKIEMSFLPDVRVLCDVCAGKRFDPETRSIEFKNTSIDEILMMGIDEATDFFSFHPHIHHTLSLMQDVGLGYLTLGQQSPTLSGGEAQRIKLVAELSKAKPEAIRPRGETLYVLDEPTIGLHMADVEKLVRVLHRLVDAGNSVIVIEHNLDVVAEADWLIDLGPEGGDGGGGIVATGTPGEVATGSNGSHTGRFLGKFLGERSSS